MERRKFQFSLRTLVLLLAVVSSFAGFYSQTTGYGSAQQLLWTALWVLLLLGFTCSLLRDSDTIKKTTGATVLKRRPWVALILGVLVLFGVFLALSETYHRSHYMCSRCRFVETRISRLGISSVESFESDYTRWYESFADPHTHKWQQSSCSIRGGYLTGYIACGRAGVVWNLTDEVRNHS